MFDVGVALPTVEPGPLGRVCRIGHEQACQHMLKSRKSAKNVHSVEVTQSLTYDVGVDDFVLGVDVDLSALILPRLDRQK